MTQRELELSVARATGESLPVIRRLGFLLADPEDEFSDPDDEALGPSVLDWDERPEASSQRPAASGQRTAGWR
jgi:hypothetical protein